MARHRHLLELNRQTFEDGRYPLTIRAFDQLDAVRAWLVSGADEQPSSE